MNNKTITFVICYFGELPKWFNFFLETCKYNDSVKFIIFNDSKKHYPPAQNVSYKKFSLYEFNRLASKKLDIAIHLSEPYKVCDFKPAFGVIFEDYLQCTDFWGHCDIDLVFGNIRSFITNEILDTYDIITAREEYLLGHFTLYRNEDKINRIYEHSKDHKFVFQRRELFSFDECNFLWWYLLAGYNILNIQSPVESMSHVVARLNNCGVIKAYFDTLMIEQEIIDVQCNLKPFDKNLQWDRGNLIDVETSKNYLYFHFHFLKKDAGFTVPLWQNIPSNFYISKKGFATTEHA